MSVRYDLPAILKTRHPNIAQACFLIALDNGGINRGRSARNWAGDFKRFIERQDGPLDEIDAWLKGLSDDDFETACTGEETEMEQLLSTAPAFTSGLLNDYFDQVC